VHREHQFVNQLDGVCLACSESGLAPRNRRVESHSFRRYPILPSTLLSIRQSRAKLSVPTDVVEMFPCCSKIIAGTRQDFHDHFRHTLTVAGCARPVQSSVGPPFSRGPPRRSSRY